MALAGGSSPEWALADGTPAPCRGINERRRKPGTAFVELKNQWGWNGYTSRRHGSTRILANGRARGGLGTMDR
jgi:hypothetical protein